MHRRTNRTPDARRARCRLSAGGALVVLIVLALVATACNRDKGFEENRPKRKTATTTTTTKPPVSPLTGLPAPSPEFRSRRALAVKIDNAPPALPQGGLEFTDLVYEEVVEGDLTRYMAVFQSQNAPLIGPVHSARFVDAQLAPALGQAVVVFSGGATPVVEAIKATGLTVISFDEGAKSLQRDRSRRAPHNVFTNSVALYDSLGGAVEGAPPPLAAFDTTPPPGTPANAVDVTFAPRTVVPWQYNAAAGRYERLRNAAVQTLVGGQPISAENLVMQFVTFKPSGIVDAAGNPSPDWETLGSGRAVVIRNGVAVEGTWTRATATAQATLRTVAGEPITLMPGRTWWSLVPTTGAVTPR